MTDALTSPTPGSPVKFEVSTNVPTTHGTFQMRAYRDLVTSADHVAIIGTLPDGSMPDRRRARPGALRVPDR